MGCDNMSEQTYLYTNANDKRTRLVIKNADGKITSKSYPRVIMESYLGRLLLPDEDVHHIDGDVTNNSIENLQIIKHGEHQRQHSQKFFDKTVMCQVCGNKFIWTSKRQQRYYADLKRNKPRIISCSISCSCYYGRMKQLNNIEEINRINKMLVQPNGRDNE